MTAAAAAAADGARQRRLGLVLVFLSAIAWSTAGFFTRLVPVDAWTTLFWRGCFGGLFIGLFTVWRLGRETLPSLRALGWRGWVITALSTSAMLTFIPALKLTTVANVAVIYAATPFVAAALSWAWLKERPSGRTLVACAAALVGVAITVGGATDAGGRWGDGLTLVMTIAVALMMVAVRRWPAVPLLPMACLSNWLGMLLSWPFADPGAVSLAGLGGLALFGLFQMTLGLTLFSFGSRLVPPTEAALIGVLDTPLSPLWVWLAFGEVPSLYAVGGGAVIVAAVAGNILGEAQPRR